MDYDILYSLLERMIRDDAVIVSSIADDLRKLSRDWFLEYQEMLVILDDMEQNEID